MYPLQFGFCLPIFAAPGRRFFRTPNYPRLDPQATMALGQLADELGYDSLWVADHLMLGRDHAILEGWTVLSALAGMTKKAKLGMIHQAHFFRYPALAAKMAATLDQISGGRLIHFIDGGNRPEEYAAYDLPWYDSVEDRISHLVEGLELTLALWQQEEAVTYQGNHYLIKEAICTPPPLQKPHPPIWIGDTRPQMVEICVRYAQGWNTTPVSLTGLAQGLQRLATTCTTRGRDMAEIEKSLEIQILIAADWNAVRQRLRDILNLDEAGLEQASRQTVDLALQAFLDGQTDELPPALTETTLIGPPEAIIDQISAYRQMGIDHFMFWFLDVPQQNGMRLFAEQVAPALKTQDPL